MHHKPFVVPAAMEEKKKNSALPSPSFFAKKAALDTI